MLIGLKRCFGGKLSGNPKIPCGLLLQLEHSLENKVFPSIEYFLLCLCKEKLILRAMSFLLLNLRLLSLFRLQLHG